MQRAHFLVALRSLRMRTQNVRLLEASRDIRRAEPGFAMTEF